MIMKAASAKTIAIILSLLLPTLFSWITVFSGASAFNLLPFEIHEAINSGGTSERAFIIIFDVIIVAILAFIAIYLLLMEMINFIYL